MLRRLLPGLLAALLLACASGSAWAPPGGRTPARPDPRPSIHEPRPATGSDQQGGHSATPDTPEARERATIQALRTGPPERTPDMGRYFGDVAVAAYLYGKLSKDLAEQSGFYPQLRYEWLELKREKGRQPNEQEWQSLVENEKARVSARKEREREQATEQIKAKAKSYAERTDKLTPQAIAGLQSAKKGRTASLDGKTAAIVVKLADDPVHDKAIIEHTWARHAVALSEKVDKSNLNVVNLFTDPIGDAVFEKVQNALGKDGTKLRASRVLTKMLTGGQPFDGATLTTALQEAQGQTFYIVSHIPKAQSGRGQVEFSDGSAPVLTEIASLQASFQAAKVNLFIVGCHSAEHATIGLSKIINNVDALSMFLQAVTSGTPRNLFQWHAAFAADALVVIDPLASEVFGRDAAEHQLSDVTLVSNGTTVSTGYAGTYVPPAAVAGINAPPSVALAVVANTLTPPEFCTVDPSPSQKEAAQRFAPAGMALLMLTLVICMMLTLQQEILAKGKEYMASMFVPVLGGAPILISAYAWIKNNESFSPGPWLGIWCLIYGAVFAAVGLSEDKRMNVWSALGVALLVCTMLFGASYFGLTADRSIRAFCVAYAQ